MNRIFALFYGVLCYGIFFATFLYLIAFVGNFWVPKTINSHPATDMLPALIINTLLVALFALQHTIMARPGFKQAFTRIIPRHLERSTYVLLSSVVLVILFWGWHGLPETLWSIEQPFFRNLLYAIFALGWAIVLLSTFLTDHFDLFGLRQVYLYFRRRPYTSPVFKKHLLYRYVRHPLMAGLILAFWATPEMTLGHLQFAVLMTVYIVIGIQFEERDLIAQHGEAYRDYQREVSMLCPFTGRRSRGETKLHEQQ